ncbi:MAG: TIGR03986 family type III CRISPR-associated RAMP protein [Methylobacter sp.]
MTNPKKSTYAFYPRWKISAELRTDSPLHIGNGELINHPSVAEVNNVNAFIKDFAKQPYLPATTLKGKLLAWIKPRIQKEQQADLDALFGEFSEKNQSGRGGRAEFHNAKLITRLKTDGKIYPDWNPGTQTYIETSTAINRTTRTVADRKLFHTELVPPNVGFEVVVTGMMTNEQADLIIGALQAFGDPKHAPTLGAEDTNGKGRMFLCGNVKAARMDAQQVCDWLNTKDFGMAYEALSELSQEIKEPKTSFADVSGREVLELRIQMDGAFLINNPTAVSEETNHQPLLDAEGKPLLAGKSLRGALRSQAERIVRSLGLDCCDTVKPCPRDEVEKELCLVCQVFGATGWQSPLHIHSFKYDEKKIRPPVPQDFVAIDRFHGGGKHKAKFNTRYYFRPKFKGFIELDNKRLPNWSKGLLALLLRDLKDGDIKLGFGANKGYGGVESITPDNFFTDEDINAFRNQFKDKFSITEQTQIAPNKANGSIPIVSNPQVHTDHYFYNPYQFIPVKVPNTENWLDKDLLNSGQHHHSHALYRQQTDSEEALYHGRLQCELTAETAFFIGANKLTPNEHPAKVENYTFDNELAIPATSLRGMVSSLAEAASNSALRVLDNGLLSYRKKTDANLPNKDRPLSAIGMVIERDNSLKLIPLALPTLEHDSLPRPFERMFINGRAALKVYLEGAYDATTATSQFLANKTTWTPECPEIYYLNLDSSHLRIDNRRLVYTRNHAALLRHPANNQNFVIGQKSIPTNSLPISEHEIGQRKATWTPGILRILGKTHREDDMPDTKTHELFIPVPREFAEDFQQFMQTARAFAITPEAIKRFNELADQRTDTQKNNCPEHEEQYLPYHLKGTARESSHELHLKHGDLVYFRPDDHNQNVVAEVSFSSIWRGRVEKDQQAAKVFDFFDPNLLPFNSARNSLSPAELLFGFVEGENAQGKKPENALAFSGKVRIDTGRLINPENRTTKQLLHDEITLKILASPKLPSPSLYFRTKPPADQTYIAKHQLNPTGYQANGRKHYLHALRQQNSTEVQKLPPTGDIARAGNAYFPWQSGNKDPATANQKVKIEPIKADTKFKFNVDFDNLTAWELGLLCYALKPSDSYRHKLGMGKPIGLGSVNIDIKSLQLIDRQKRYAKDPLNAVRYNGATLDIDTLRNDFIETMDKDIRQAIELLGNPGNVNAPVHYPQLSNRPIEEKIFQWFVANDNRRDGNQQLGSIDENTTQLPPLNR